MKITSNRLVAVILAAVSLLVTGCSSSGGGGGGNNPPPPPTNVSFDAAPVIDNVADNIIEQTYVDLNTSALALLTAVTDLEATINDANMDAAQQAWKDSRVPWESSEGFLFGPVDSLGVDPAIDSWPLDTTVLADFIANVTNPDKDFIALTSDDVRGFHAIEFLLFGDPTQPIAPDNDKTAAELTDADADYLLALTGALQDQTQLLTDSWTVDFVDADGNSQGPYDTILKTQGAGQIYASQGAALEEIIEGIIIIADEVGNAKIAEPFGNDAASSDVSQVESQYSWNSLTDFHNNIQSILNIYTGSLGYDWQTDPAPTGLNGVYDFVAAHDATLAETVLNTIIMAQQTVALVDGDNDNTTTDIDLTAGDVPFRDQIGDDVGNGRQLVQDAIDAVNAVQATFENDVVPLIGDTDFAN